MADVLTQMNSTKMSKMSHASKVSLNRIVTLGNINRPDKLNTRPRRNTHNIYEFRNTPHDILAAYSPMRIISGFGKKNKLPPAQRTNYGMKSTRKGHTKSLNKTIVSPYSEVIQR